MDVLFCEADWFGRMCVQRFSENEHSAPSVDFPNETKECEWFVDELSIGRCDDGNFIPFSIEDCLAVASRGYQLSEK